MACLSLTLAMATPFVAHGREPIIDMHVHALAADDQGPPPLAMCVPIDPMPTWDDRLPTMQNFITPFKNPSCKDPIWSPETTAEVMRRFGMVPKVALLSASNFGSTLILPETMSA